MPIILDKIAQKVNEDSTSTVGIIVKDDAGVVIPGTSLTTAVWSLKNDNDKSVINGRTSVNFLPSIDVNGVGTIALAALDNLIVSKSSKLDEERHILTIEIIGPSVALKEEIVIIIINLHTVGT